MKIFIVASDKYSHLIAPNMLLLNRYFPDNDVVCLGYDIENMPENMPENFSFVSLGEQTKEWTTPLIEFFENVEDEYFIILLEDVLIVGDVDKDKFAILENEIATRQAQKAMLDIHLNNNVTPYKDGIVSLSQAANYRTSLHPAIWNKDYFLKFLKPQFSIWDFEVKNMKESKFDGANIISLDTDENLFKVVNVYDKGQAAPRFDRSRTWGANSGITKQDIEMIYNYLPASIVEKNKKYLESLEDDVLYY